jgi:hypothetical protein
MRWTPIDGLRIFGKINASAKMTINLKMVFAFVMGMAWAPFSYGQAYEYADLFGKRSYLTIQISPAIFADLDRGFQATYCDQKDAFVCVSSEPFNFAVPRTLSSTSENWKYNGNSYQLLHKTQMSVLGFQVKAWVIGSDQAGGKFRFFYSVDKGLLAIAVYAEGGYRMFISTREFGFGKAQ